jgi:hypothetical protein
MKIFSKLLLVCCLVVFVEECGGSIEADLFSASDDLVDELVHVLHALVEVFAADLETVRLG